MKPPLGLAFLVAATAAVAPLAASAADDVEQAKALFNAGAQAYAATRYQDAVHSFQAAYRKAPRPAILFSLAQAYRRLYVIDPKPESLKAAIANYRRYLAEVPQGGRRADATEALSELEVVAARLDVHAPAAAPAEPEVAVEVKPRTRINVTSPTAGARVSLDGGAPVDVPLMAEVQPGKHTIKLTADGFADEEREILAVEGDVTGLDRELRERPARIEITAPEGAQVMLDGRLVGTTPLPVIEVAPGRRFFAVTLNGYKPFSRELSLRRGQSQAVNVTLSTTTQRTASYGFFIAGGLTAGAGVLTLLHFLAAQGEARALWDKRRDERLTEQELRDYKEHLDDAGQYGFATMGLMGAAATMALTGFVFYAFDASLPPPPPARTEPTPSREARPTLDLAAAPLLAPGVAGARLTGRF
jgi:hypothetical protein